MYAEASVRVLAGEGRALVPKPVAPLQRVHGLGCYEFRFVRKPVGGIRKRILDLALASLALLFLLPFLLTIAAMIRLDSPGPALFRQKRTGFRGRTFQVLKFRTMREASRSAPIEQATPDDTRVTRIGRFLRRMSLDELPQLINVVRGEMSLVGPRPHAFAHDKAFWAINHAYPRRFTARPGITGRAQICGHRGRTETPDRVQARLACDLAYIDHWSLLGDIRILFATVRLLIRDANAY